MQCLLYRITNTSKHNNTCKYDSENFLAFFILSNIKIWNAVNTVTVLYDYLLFWQNSVSPNVERNTWGVHYLLKKAQRHAIKPSTFYSVNKTQNFRICQVTLQIM